MISDPGAPSQASDLRIISNAAKADDARRRLAHMGPDEVMREIEDVVTNAPRDLERTEHVAYMLDLEYRAQELGPDGARARAAASAAWGALGQKWGQLNVMHAHIIDIDNALDEVERRDYAVRHGGEIDTGYRDWQAKQAAQAA